MLENRFIEQDTVIDKVTFLEDNGLTPVAYSMGVTDYVVRASNSIDSASDGVSITVTLPNVVDAKGRIYTVVATAIANAGAGLAGDIVVTTDGAEDIFGGDYTLTAADDFVIMYSDGFCWHTLNSITT